MKFALIACSVMCRDLSFCIAGSQNIIFPIWLKQGLHNTPHKLKEMLQEKIDEIEEMNNDFSNKEKFSAILLGYGLCSNSIIGLKSKSIKLVIPKCDDCIAIFLGSQKRYLEIFNSQNGIYWYNKGWIEQSSMPSKEHYQLIFEHYKTKYDEDTAEFLLEQETSYIEKYESCIYIKSKVCDEENEVNFTKKVAKDFKWEYMEINSDLSLIENLLNGNWNEQFLICNQGQMIVPDYSGGKIAAKEAT